MLYASETWYLTEEMAILRRTERATIRAMCDLMVKQAVCGGMVMY